MSKSSKGAVWEREVCRSISLWWSQGQDDSWFWRASQSGGRATQRAKKGLSTMNACGDIAAMCPEAQKLLDIVTLELKRGYPKVCIADLWEKDHGGFHEFVEQSRKSAQLAGTPFHAVIHKRDRRNPVIYLEDLSDPIGAIIRPFYDFLTPASRDWLLLQWEIRIDTPH